MIGENIKKFRTEKKLSLRALSEKSRISKTTINEIENGIVTNPTLDTIEKIAKALERTSEDLLGTFGRLAQLINYSIGINLEKSSQSTGIPEDYLRKLCNGDISEPPSVDILKKIADDPENLYGGDYPELLEAAGYIDRKTEQVMRKDKLNKFDETFDINELKKTLNFLESNPLLLKYFESSNFTDKEIDKIIEYMNFIISQRNKK